MALAGELTVKKNKQEKSDMDMKQYAAKNLLKAIKSGDPRSVADAFSEMMDSCGDNEEEEYEEEEMN